MNKTLLLKTLFAGLLVLHGSSARGQTFTDGFEAAALDGYWGVLELNGSVGPAGPQAHSGQRTAQFTTHGSGNKEVQLLHNFAVPVYGTTSVWVYDAGADTPSGNYIEFYAILGGIVVGQLGTQDYDLGPSNGGNYYYSNGGAGVATSIDRTQGWHQFEITSQPNLLRLSVDGIPVFSSTGGTPFDRLAISVHAPGFRPGITVQADDFHLNSSGNPSLSIDDGFEGSALNPFWSVFELNGTVGVAGPRAHSGQQAAQFTTRGDGNKEVQLFHNFAAPVYGTTSVWVYDAGADVDSGNYIEFSVGNSALAGTLVGQLGTQDYDLGPSNGGNYYYSAGGSLSVATSIDRTQAWHQFEITSQPNLLRLSVDGISVFSSTSGTPFDRITLNVHAPGFRPGMTVQADDFCFIPANSSFAAWLAEHGLQGESGSPSAVNNTQGIPNLMAYALGIDPFAGANPGTRARLPRFENAQTPGESPVFSLMLPVLHPPDITWVVEQSTDLVSWPELCRKSGASPWTGLGVGTEGAAADCYYPVSIRLPVAAARTFFRLTVLLE